jgi:hypothetical protein
MSESMRTGTVLADVPEEGAGGAAKIGVVKSRQARDRRRANFTGKDLGEAGIDDMKGRWIKSARAAESVSPMCRLEG